MLILTDSRLLWGLLTLVALLAGVLALAVWRSLARIEGKLEVLAASCRDHRLAQERQFVHRGPHEEEHRDLWRAINIHCVRPRTRR